MYVIILYFTIIYNTKISAMNNALRSYKVDSGAFELIGL